MSRSRHLAILYAAAGAVHLAGVGAGGDPVRWLTKPVLMPLLALYAAAAFRERGGRISRRLIVALALAWAGDIVLLLDGTPALIVGMLLFAGAYGLYAAEFIRSGALRRLRRWPRWLAPLGYAAFTTAGLAWLWPGLSERSLALPMAGYGALLTVMASTAATRGLQIGVGAALLLFSDTLIGVDLAGAAELPGPPIWVMTTYLLGQALVVNGWIASRTPQPSSRDQGVPQVVRATSGTP
jgi:uncharacterized membrane protein YhhN